MKTNFNLEGKFYKGNIHAHTTRSDGNLSSEEMISIYREKGYNFVAITDHNIYSNYLKFSDEEFITIQSSEVNPTMPIDDVRAFHFIILPDSRDNIKKAKLPFFKHDEVISSPLIETMDDLSLYIDNLKDRGYMVMCNHPFWSRIEYDDIMGLKNIFAIEVFNNASCIQENMGESNVLWDALLRNNYKVLGTAVDDNHNSFSLDSVESDSFGGFIMVKAKSLGEEDICDAIRIGSFYSSMGPEIYDFYIEDNSVYLKCSGVSKIYKNGDNRQIKAKLSNDGENTLTEFTCKLEGSEKYVRIEIYDKEGKKAYTNPIWL